MLSTITYIFILLYSDIDECSQDTDECHDNAACTDTIGNYNCSCDIGYEGDGFNCTSKGVIK